MIAGSSDIHCKETGKWSDDVPKCIDITCKASHITNGAVVEQMPEYRKGAILEYKCNPGFKKREGIPKCAKFGWTIKPECDEVTCELKSTTFGIEKIQPKGKTIFRAGESVEITCSEKYWLIFTKETSKTFRCQDNGKWDNEPVCQEIRCEVPRDQYVYYPYDYFRGDMKLGTKKDYRCDYGYDKMEAKATCTEDGWTPKPLCAKTCAAPNIPNAQIVRGSKLKYLMHSRIEYQCHPGFEPEQPVQITCNSWARWTGIQQCTEKTCAAPNILNAEIVGRREPNYRINSRIQYNCRPGFEPEQTVEITCDFSTQWTGIQQCTVKQELCPDPSVKNGFIYNQPSNKETIFYSCNKDYKPFTGKWWDSVTCSKGSWPLEHRCIPKEECGALPSVHHGKLKQTKETFRDGDTTAFECDPGFISTSRFIKCTNGTWEKPDCKVGVHCGIPPKVENAVITSKPEEFYVDESSVTYVCRNSFLISGESMVFCRNGTWEKTPTCEEATCPLQWNTTEDLNFEGLPDIKGPVKNGHKLTFSCIGEGMRLKGQREITCQSNGKWNAPFPKCIGQNSGKCGKPPRVNNSDITDMEKKEYNTGETVKYQCFDKYILETRHPYSNHLTCEQGQWSGKIKCLKPCSVTLEEMDRRGIELRWRDQQKMFAPHNDHITFKCQKDKESVGVDLKQPCNDGDMTLPKCESPW